MSRHQPMIDIAATLGQSILSGLCMLLFASVVSAWGYWGYRQLIRPLSLSQQALSILAYSILAPLSTLIALLVLSYPSLAAIVLYAHCHGADCSPHSPASIIMSVTGATLIAGATLISFLALYVITKAIQTSKANQTALDSLARPKKTGQTGYVLHYKLIESEELVAWCAGLFFPKIYVSTGLVNSLTDEQLHAVLAHEQGHVKGFDNLQKLLLLWSSALWFARAKQQIRQDFNGQIEQISDFYSAKITGNKNLVRDAYAILKADTSLTENQLYKHRNDDNQSLALEANKSTLKLCSVCLLWSVLFVGYIVGLTTVTHSLMEWI